MSTPIPRKRLQTFELCYLKYDDGTYGYRAGPIKSVLYFVILAKFRVKVRDFKISGYHLTYAVTKTDNSLKEYLKR